LERPSGQAGWSEIQFWGYVRIGATVALVGGLLFGVVTGIAFAGHLRDFRADAVLWMVALPLGVTAFLLTLVASVPVLIVLSRLANLDPTLERAFEWQSRRGRWGRLLADYLDMIGLYTGHRDDLPASVRGFAALAVASVLVAIEAIIEATIGAGVWFWSLTPKDPLAAAAHAYGLETAQAIGQVVLGLSIVFAAATFVGLIRTGGGKDSVDDRAFVTFCYVIVDVLWFTLLYHGGSVGGLLEFKVDPHDLVALSGPQSLLLALGTLTTAGAPGITPLNDWARIAMLFELATLAILASWFIGAAERARELWRRSAGRPQA
jgi:hypothetical protein